MKHPRCPECAGEDLRTHLEGPPHVCRCDSCGLLFLAEFPEPDEVASFYQEEYYEEETGERFLGPLEGIVRFFRWRRMWDITAHLPPRRSDRPDAILDVGCGRGALLECFERRGWLATGTQLSETARAACESRCGAEVLLGELPDLRLESESFRAVALYHVLEHLECPGTYLREIQRVLRPDGLLVVEVPDASGPGFRVLGVRNFCLDYPHHLFFFTPPALRALLERVGFDVVAESRFSLEYGPYTMLQNILNLIPGEPNRFYRSLMRNAEGRRLRRQPLTWLHAALASALALPVLVSSLVSLVLPVGNTLRLYCKKRQPVVQRALVEA